MFQPCQSHDSYAETVHMVTVIIPHIIVVITSLMGILTSRKNRREIREVKRALNGKAHSSKERP